MRTLRVPRSGSTIVSMLVALLAVTLLPVVFMAALAQSAETQPRSLAATLSTLARPLATRASGLWERAVALARR